MPYSITDYLAMIEEHDTQSVCNIISLNIIIEEGLIRSSSPDFFCLEENDVFILIGTEYSDGIYKKVNGVDAYDIFVEPYREEFSLSSEVCVGNEVVISRVDSIGDAQALLSYHFPPVVRARGWVGSVGDLNLELSQINIFASATSGIVGNVALPDLISLSVGEQETFSFLEFSGLQGNVTASSGSKAIFNTPSFKCEGTGVQKDTVTGEELLFGSADTILSALNISGVDSTAKASYWANGTNAIPSFLGVDYYDIEANLPFFSCQANLAVQADAHIFPENFLIRATAFGASARSILPSLDANVSGSSQNRGFCNLPFFEAQVYTGAFCRNTLPSFV